MYNNDRLARGRYLIGFKQGCKMFVHHSPILWLRRTSALPEVHFTQSQVRPEVHKAGGWLHVPLKHSGFW